MKIFVSYRRSDSQDIAARIVDRLNETPGVKQVFFDVQSIAPGKDFAQSIEASLSACDLCLVLIGDNWRGTEVDGKARFDDPADFVRQETATALRLSKRVIPVLLNNANMPDTATLPEDSQALATLNATFIRHLSFNQDLDILADAIFDRPRGGQMAQTMKRHPMLHKGLKSLSGLLVAVITLIILAAIHKSLTGNALNESVGNGVAWLIILGVLAAGASWPLWWKR